MSQAIDFKNCFWSSGKEPREIRLIYIDDNLKTIELLAVNLQK